MAKLTTAKRKALPARDFGLPAKHDDKGKRGSDENKAGRGAYPMPDKEHAIVAKSYASKEERVGKLSKGNEEKIDVKANREIRKDGGHPAPTITAHTDGRANTWTRAKERAFKAERAARRK